MILSSSTSRVTPFLLTQHSSRST